jgi:hypothetical protein
MPQVVKNVPLNTYFANLRDTSNRFYFGNKQKREKPRRNRVPVPLILLFSWWQFWWQSDCRFLAKSGKKVTG